MTGFAGFLGALLAAVTSLVPVGAGPLMTGACDGTLRTRTAGTVEDDALTEISGIDRGVTNPGVWWVHNDSGDSARVFAISSTGAPRGEFAVTGATAVDIEDLAVARDPVSGDGVVYLADIGDNAGVRADIVVYRFPEPDLEAPGDATAPADALHFVYPDGTHDAEALLVDPVRGNLVIVTKSGPGGHGGIYTAPADAAPGGTTTLTAAGVMQVEPAPVGLVTGGDLSSDGRTIAIRSYGAVTFLDRAVWQSVPEALVGEGCPVRVVERQGESVAFATDARSVTTVSEGEHPRLRTTGLRPAR